MIGFAAVLLIGSFVSAFAGPSCPGVRAAFTPNGDMAKDRIGGRTNGSRILAIGSSSTEGIGASRPTHSYPAILQSLLETRFPKRSIHVVNAGIGGETAVRTLVRLETAVTTRHYDLVIWQVGTNDAVRHVDENVFRTILESGITAVQQTDTPLILVDPQYFPRSARNKNYADFVRIVDNAGKRHHVPVLSRYALMKGWAGESANLLTAMLAKDGFHMSDQGYACWANLLAGEIAPKAPTLLATQTRDKARVSPADSDPNTTRAPALIP